MDLRGQSMDSRAHCAETLFCLFLLHVHVILYLIARISLIGNVNDYCVKLH